jgi:hypothetical protein
MSGIDDDTSGRAKNHARVTTSEPVAGWRRPSHGRGLLKPFAPGNKLGGRRGTRYCETVALAREHSLEAVHTLVERLRDPDGRIAVVAANSVLERAWGRVREAKPEEQPKAQIDLSALTRDELQLLVRLAVSGRIKAVDSASTEEVPTIEVKPE